MRRCMWILVIVLTVGAYAQNGSATPAADLVQTHRATEIQLREYFQVTRSIEQAHKIMRQMVDGMQVTAAPYIPKSFWDDFRSTFDSVDLAAAMIPAYQKYFSEEDMEQVLLFYKSVAGQHLLAAQPLIISSAGDVLRKQGEELGRKVGERHRDEIEAAKRKYDEDVLAKQNGSNN